MIVAIQVFLMLTVFVTHFNSLCLGYHLFPHSNVTLSRYRRQSDCKGLGQFPCDGNDECIPIDEKCDGTADCTDGSDETSRNCKNTQCPEHDFQCKYGACIDGDFKCDSEVDCADGSDEDPVLCGSSTTQKPTTPQPPLSNGFCAVPIIENGKYLVKSNPYVQGTPIPNLSIVTFSCNKHYALYPSVSEAFCNDGSWNTKLPECRQTCSPRISSSVDVTCTIDGKIVSCNESVLEGTVAKSKCKHFYTSADVARFPTSRCSGGSWDNPLIRCVPECGEVIPKGVTNIVNGVAAKTGEFPWHIALYHLQDGIHRYQCGGSLVTPLVVISAAHCFTTENGDPYPPEEYYVGAGKYYSAYNAPQDKLAQIRQVKEFHIPSLYRGYDNNFAADIVVIIVKKSFQLTNVVQPVCVDWDKKFEKDQLKPDSRGSVVGWGHVDPKNPTANEELKQLTAPYIDTGACLNVVPPDFIRWVTSDKFCTGLTNGSSVCQGDSGSGIVFPWTSPLTNRVKYYLRGIVSIGPVKDDVCDNRQYGVYTLASQYNDFIQNIIANNPVVD